MEPEETARRVGIELRVLRIRADWSQERLAAEAKMHANRVGMIERGEANPTLGVLVRLAAALDVSPARFFEEPIAGVRRQD